MTDLHDGFAWRICMTDLHDVVPPLESFLSVSIVK